MKNILLTTFCLFVTIVVHGQEFAVDQSTGLISFSEVIQTDSTSKDILYIRAREWFATAFKSSNDALQMDNKEAGKLIGKGYQQIYPFMVAMKVPYRLWYTLKVDVKDNRWRYEITNLQFEAEPSQANNFQTLRGDAEPMLRESSTLKNGKPNKTAMSLKEETVKGINLLIKNLKAEMSKAGNTAGNNW